MYSVLSLIAAILLQVPSPALAETGSIEGLVLGPNGEPIPAARIQAMWSPSPLAVDPRTIPVATTGADGRFRLDGLSPSGYRLSVSAPGYRFNEDVWGISRQRTVGARHHLECRGG